eukprot:151425_1
MMHFQRIYMSTNKHEENITAISEKLMALENQWNGNATFINIQYLTFGLCSKNKLVNAYNTISRTEKKHIATGSTLPDGVSSMAIYYNFMNSLPHVYPNTGLFGGILLQFLFAILSIYTLKILIIAQKQNVHDYEQLGYKCFGNIG